MKEIFVLSHSWGTRYGATTVGTFSTSEKAVEFRDAVIEIHNVPIGNFVIFNEELDPSNPSEVAL